MSPENRGVFQLLEEVIFRRILVFCSSCKWGCFFGILGVQLVRCDRQVGNVQEILAREKNVDHRIFYAVTMFLLLQSML